MNEFIRAMLNEAAKEFPVVINLHRVVMTVRQEGPAVPLVKCEFCKERFRSGLAINSGEIEFFINVETQCPEGVDESDSLSDSPTRELVSV